MTTAIAIPLSEPTMATARMSKQMRRPVFTYTAGLMAIEACPSSNTVSACRLPQSGLVLA